MRRTLIVTTIAALSLAACGSDSDPATAETTPGAEETTDTGAADGDTNEVHGNGGTVMVWRAATVAALMMPALVPRTRVVRCWRVARHAAAATVPAVCPHWGSCGNRRGHCKHCAPPR